MISLDTEQLNRRLNSVVAENEVSDSEMDSKTLSERRIAQLFPKHTPITRDSILHAQTSLQISCDPLCMCRCHHSINIQTPTWLKGLLGLLFFGYSGSPLLPRGSCDQKACRKQSSSILKVDYYFPSWLIHRMIVLRNQTTPRDGHMLTVRTPRVVDNLSEIFNACKYGNMDRVRCLFAEGLASPFDVDSGGVTPLLASITHV